MLASNASNPIKSSAILASMIAKLPQDAEGDWFAKFLRYRNEKILCCRLIVRGRALFRMCAALPVHASILLNVTKLWRLQSAAPKLAPA